MVEANVEVGIGGLAESKFATGKVTAPLANATIVGPLIPGAGSWLVESSTVQGGAVIAAADIGNVGIYRNGSLIGRIPVAGFSRFTNVILALVATDSLELRAVGNATAAMEYSGNIIATRVG